MKRFSRLYEELDRTTSTNAKVAALRAYFASSPPADAAWALFFLTGERLKRLLAARLLWKWTRELTGLPGWLLDESHAAVGDFAETIALLLERSASSVPRAQFEPSVSAFRVPSSPLDVSSSAFRAPSSALPASNSRLPFGDEPIDVTEGEALSLAEWIEGRLLRLRGRDESEQRRLVLAWWRALDRRELFLLNKLLTGEFRVGVSRTLVVRAVAEAAGLATTVVEHRLSGAWQPSAGFFRALSDPEPAEENASRPYPFFLASPLQGGVEALGDRDEWLAEWKWDGIRAQVIRRHGQVYVWSRGDELITERFPELGAAAGCLPDGTVLDGEILAYRAGRPLSFAHLQHRIGLKTEIAQVSAEIPVVFMAFDVLEDAGADVRDRPLRWRRDRLVDLTTAGTPQVQLSGALDGSWEELHRDRDAARTHGVEGIMLKRWSAGYGTGRRRHDWWKWKIDPFTVDVVLLYAQPGSGRRASLFTDYTFAVWRGNELVPIAKAYSGLSDAEIDQLDRWIRRHTTDRFGPVSVVEPVHVFELGFDRIGRSSRHKSGVALRFPRILRWRTDKTPKEADTLDMLLALLEAQG